MDLFTSNTILISAIGIILSAMILYSVTYLRRKYGKQTNFVHLIYQFIEIIRDIAGKAGTYASLLKNKNNIKKSETRNRGLERFGNPNYGHSPSGYPDAPHRLKTDNPFHSKTNSGNPRKSYAKSPFSHTTLGNLNFESRKYGKAALHYKQALQIDRNYDPAHVGMGKIEYNHGRVLSAMRHFAFAVNKNENNHDALVGLGNCYQQIHNYEEALRCYEQAYKINDTNKDLNAELSNLYMARKEYQKANDVLTRSIAIDPCCSRFYKSIGDINSILYKEKEAVDAYINFLKLRCDRDKLTNLVRSRFERYLALEIISDLVKREKKINYDSFIKEMSKMMTIFLIRQRILGKLNNTKKKAYLKFSNDFIHYVLLTMVQKEGHPLNVNPKCNMFAEHLGD